MFYLLLTIALTSYLFFVFKLFKKYEINTLQAIVVNYFVCVVTGSLFAQGGKSVFSFFSADWIPVAALLGLSFILVFYLIAFSSQKVGVSITSVASKMSLIIPVFFSVFFITQDLDSLTLKNYVLLFFTLIAVFLSSYKGTKETQVSAAVKIPILVFLGTGLVDTLINYSNSIITDPFVEKIFPVYSFFFAAIIGSTLLLIQLIKNKTPFPFKSIIAGVALGVPNYFSIYYLLKSLSFFNGNGAFVFPVANIGVILFSTVFSVLFFKEKLTKMNWAGIAISVIVLVLFTTL